MLRDALQKWSASFTMKVQILLNGRNWRFITEFMNRWRRGLWNCLQFYNCASGLRHLFLPFQSQSNSVAKMLNRLRATIIYGWFYLEINKGFFFMSYIKTKIFKKVLVHHWLMGIYFKWSPLETTTLENVKLKA